MQKKCINNFFLTFKQVAVAYLSARAKKKTNKIIEEKSIAQNAHSTN